MALKHFLVYIEANENGPFYEILAENFVSAAEHVVRMLCHKNKVDVEDNGIPSGYLVRDKETQELKKVAVAVHASFRTTGRIITDDEGDL